MINDDAGDRKALIEALNALGIPAYEYHSGGGIMHVTADIVDDAATDDLLQVATGSSDTDCDVGLMGWLNGESWEAPDWTAVHSMQEAIERFAELWADREQLAASFRDGTLGNRCRS